MMQPYQARHMVRSARKPFMWRVVMMIAVSLAAAICYGVTVYAWFQASIVNSGNFIQAGSFSANVELYTEDGTLWWSSAWSDPEGIVGYSGEITPLSSSGIPVRVKITSLSTDLTFQYQLTLATTGADAQIVCDAGLTVPDVLGPGGYVELPVTWPAGTVGITALQLEFRTGFHHGAIQTLALVTQDKETSTILNVTPTDMNMPEDGMTAHTTSAAVTTMSGEMTTTSGTTDTTSVESVTTFTAAPTTSVETTTTSAAATTTSVETTTTTSAVAATTSVETTTASAAAPTTSEVLTTSAAATTMA